MNNNVPLFNPNLDSLDKKAIISSLNSPHLTDGPLLRKFENSIKKISGAKHAVGVSNGTSALFLSLLSLGIKKNDEIIVPDLTFVATASAVLATGAKPVLVDINNDLNISAEKIEEKINKHTKAIIPVHFAGYPCDMKKIMKTAKKYGIKVVEDCAHAFGAFYNNRHVGTFGTAGCFSFYPTKNITTIEGGVIISNSKTIQQKSSILRNHGLSKTLTQRNNATKPWNYDVVSMGYNLRLDEVRSSLGLSQLKRFNKFKNSRIKAAKYYDKNLEKITGIELIPYENKKSHVYHLYIIKIKKNFKKSRNKVHEELFKKGIKSTVHYKPLHKFSILKDKYDDRDFPNTMKIFNECLSIPLFPSITKKQQDFVISSLKSLQN